MTVNGKSSPVVCRLMDMKMVEFRRKRLAKANAKRKQQKKEIRMKVTPHVHHVLLFLGSHGHPVTCALAARCGLGGVDGDSTHGCHLPTEEAERAGAGPRVYFFICLFSVF